MSDQPTPPSQPAAPMPPPMAPPASGPQIGGHQGQQPPGYYAPGTAGAPTPTMQLPGQGAPGPGPTGDLPLASWGQRAVAMIIDMAIGYVPFVVLFFGWVLGVNRYIWTRDYEWETAPPVLGLSNLLITLVLSALLVVYLLWNLGIKQGSTGQSIGKKIMGIKVAKKADLQPTGAGLGIVRWLANSFLSGLCFLNWLWPLFDQQRQAWHDMALNTYVLRAPKQR